MTKNKKSNTLYRDVNLKKNKIKGGFKMVEQANVSIRNYLENEIQVVRELADGTPEENWVIAYEDEETIFLPEPGVSLVITPDIKVDTATCTFKVTYNANIVAWEARNGHWRVQLAANDEDPEVPTDVNIEIGEEPPMP